METITNITERLFARVSQHPKRPAYSYEGDTPLSYGELWAWVDHIREALRNGQIKRGERVVLLTPISREVVPLIIALFAEQVVPVLIDPRLKKREWLRAIALSKAQHFISVPPLLHLRWFWWPLLRLRHHALAPLTRRISPQGRSLHPPVATAPDDEVLITLTSGTTGQAKLIVRHQSVLLAQQTLSSKYLPPLKQDIHLTAFAVAALQALIDGAFVILVREAHTAKVQSSLSHFSPTRVSGSPAFLMDVIDSPSFRAPSVLCVMTGGAPLPRWFLQKLRKSFLNADVWTVYGSTECEPIALTNVMSEGPGYFVGSPISELELHPHEIDQAKGQAFFEIRLSGPNIVTESGLLNTGDIARSDQNGHLWLLGRRADMIHGWPSGLLEEPLEGRHGVRRIAFVENEKGIHGFVELETSSSQPDAALEAFIRAHLQEHGLSLASLTVLPQLFVDRRHRWKIQRDRLREICP